MCNGCMAVYSNSSVRQDGPEEERGRVPGAQEREREREPVVAGPKRESISGQAGWIDATMVSQRSCGIRRYPGLYPVYQWYISSLLSPKSCRVGVRARAELRAVALSARPAGQ